MTIQPPRSLPCGTLASPSSPTPGSGLHPSGSSNAAHELTINLCSDLLKEGWLLKDATPLNVLFKGVSPVFVDVLSIERAAPGPAHLALAYGQFVRTFLLPMLAHSKLGWPLELALTRRDGYEPEEIFDALSLPNRMQQPALSTVTLPTLLAKNQSLRPQNLATRTLKDPDLAKQILLKTLRNLLNHMRKITPAHKHSTWSDYAETATHYNDEEPHPKTRLRLLRPRLLPPTPGFSTLGCNTGVYSNLAADAGAEVVSIDTDLQAVDRLCATLKNSGKNILPLHVNLAHTQPLHPAGKTAKPHPS